MPLTIVIPVHNEAEVIEEVVKGFYDDVIRKRPGSDLLVVEDGSTDGTREILRRLSDEIPMTLITGEERKGYMQGLKDALLQAKGDIIFYSDSDNTHNPKDFWKLYRRLTNSDLVCGVKVNRCDPLYRKFLSMLYNLLVYARFGIYIKDINSGFKIMNRKVLESVVPDIRHLKYGFSTELVIRSQKKGFNISWVPVQHFGRTTGNADQFQLSNIPVVVKAQLRGLKSLKQEIEGRP
ncbi:MAG: hypothetical protein AYK23_00295 [Candidatus Proteinoplasmatales archaeon SG8-5]|nr:MAG: hypothetical protein AYK23_00295 [Candidatus Proteinoplasmatales archaeon SG8-5]